MNRTLTMIQNYFSGRIEEIEEENERDRNIRLAFEKAQKQISQYYDGYALNKALEEIWVYINSVNKYLADSEPWKLSKDNTKRKQLGRILHQTAAAIRAISYLIYPVMPESASKIWTSLGEDRSLEQTLVSEFRFEDFQLGQEMQKPKPLFPRVDLKDFLKEEVSLSPKQDEEEKMDYVTFEEFKKMDLRVGEILKADRVEGTQKLLKMEVDIGEEKRTMVAGIAETYSPEELEGKKLIVIVNLKPAVIRGVESQAMLLAADIDGKAYMPFFTQDIPAGAKVR